MRQRQFGSFPGLVWQLFCPHSSSGYHGLRSSARVCIKINADIVNWEVFVVPSVCIWKEQFSWGGFGYRSQNLTISQVGFTWGTEGTCCHQAGSQSKQNPLSSASKQLVSLWRPSGPMLYRGPFFTSDPIAWLLGSLVLPHGARWRTVCVSSLGSHRQVPVSCIFLSLGWACQSSSQICLVGMWVRCPLRYSLLWPGCCHRMGMTSLQDIHTSLSCSGCLSVARALGVLGAHLF